MSVVLNFGRDVQGFNTFAPPFSGDKYSATLAASGNASITLPSTFASWIISFNYTSLANMWVSVNGTAEVPAGATFALTTSQLNPGALSVKSGDVINILNAGIAAAGVSIIMYGTI